MCNSANCSHLDDQIDDIFGDIFGADPVEPSAPADVTLAEAQQYKMHKENCPSCKGSGVFRSYMGRVVGNCFKRKGRGHMFYRQSVEQREKARSRDCDAEAEAAIVAVCADPAAAAEAYGRMTGQCSCCGRALTNAESVARSIGPICAGKWGF